jgi:hypothetical protein
MIVEHGTVQHGTVLNPYFNRTVFNFKKNQHSTTHNSTESRHDTIQHESTIKNENTA